MQGQLVCRSMAKDLRDSFAVFRADSVTFKQLKLMSQVALVRLRVGWTMNRGGWWIVGCVDISTPRIGPLPPRRQLMSQVGLLRVGWMGWTMNRGGWEIGEPQ